MNKTITVIVLFLFHIAIATGSVVTFDTLPCSTCNLSLANYEENGVIFTGSFSQYSMEIPGNSNNGSTGAIRFPLLSSVRIQLSDGAAFSLNSVDLAEYNNAVTGIQQTVEFRGLTSGNATVSQSFIIDGLMDGAGGINDFETVSFSSEFTQLVHVDISSDMFSMDNLKINEIPIPAAAWLFLSGILGMAGLAVRKTDSKALGSE